MPITPDLPFPKGPGDAIRSKDWNDLVTETQRLDNAKVNRSGDAIGGPLTIAGALAVGSSAAAAARLHVVDTASPATLRIQSTQAFGTAQVEFWSDPLGSGTEWRPGLIRSIDAGGFTGGLAFLTNGTGVANRTALVETMRLVNGNVAIGTPDPGGFRVSIAGRAADQQTLLMLCGDQDIRGKDRLNFIKFGNQGDYQILHKASGHYGRNTLGLHCAAADAIGVYSTGWNPLLEVAGGSGDLFVKGSATVPGGLVFEGAVAHIDRDGALYRNTDGQCYLTVDDHLYFRKSGATGQPIHFDVGAGTLGLSGHQDIRGKNLLNLMKFGNQGDYQVLHKVGGHYGRNTLALHCDAADAIGIYSTGWVPLLEVAGGSGDVFVKGSYLEINGGGGERCYIGGDGAGGDVQIGSMNAGIRAVTAWNTVNGYMDIYCAALHQGSDLALKTNVTPLSGALDQVCALRGVRFDWKSQEDDQARAHPGEGRNLGLIAQEVAEVLPELVSESRGTLSVAYTALIPLLIEAIKDLRLRVDRLEGTAGAAPKPKTAPRTK